jgi:hypothetical protein
MKLLLCLDCHDVIKLVHLPRTCLCGNCGGQIYGDGLHGEYWGAQAIPLGFANSSLLRAVENQPQSGLGKLFNAFVIPKVCPTLKLISNSTESL